MYPVNEMAKIICRELLIPGTLLEQPCWGSHCPTDTADGGENACVSKYKTDPSFWK
jgi:hypothetical protein